MVIIKIIILAAQRHRNSVTNAMPLFQRYNTIIFCHVELCTSLFGARGCLVLVTGFIVAYDYERLRYI